MTTISGRTLRGNHGGLSLGIFAGIPSETPSNISRSILLEIFKSFPDGISVAIDLLLLLLEGSPGFPGTFQQELLEESSKTSGRNLTTIS